MTGVVGMANEGGNVEYAGIDEDGCVTAWLTAPATIPESAVGIDKATSACVAVMVAAVVSSDFIGIEVVISFPESKPMDVEIGTGVLVRSL